MVDYSGIYIIMPSRFEELRSRFEELPANVKKIEEGEKERKGVEKGKVT